MHSDLKRGYSTCNMFGLTGSNTAGASDAVKTRLYNHFPPSVRCVWIDELSFLTKEHFGSMHQQAKVARLETMKDVHDTGSMSSRLIVDHTGELPFGGLHVVMSGDLFQHEPITGAPLFRDASKSTAEQIQTASSVSSSAAVGMKIWSEQMTDVFILREIHRQHGDDPGVEKLKRYSAMFASMTPDQVTRDQISEFLDDLNNRAVPDLSIFQHECPRVVVTRNAVRSQINRKLVFMIANATKKRVITWSSIDEQPNGTPLPPAVKAAVANMPANKCKELNGIHFYFDGIKYAFIDNEFPEVRSVFH